MNRHPNRSFYVRLYERYSPALAFLLLGMILFFAIHTPDFTNICFWMP